MLLTTIPPLCVVMTFDEVRPAYAPTASLAGSAIAIRGDISMTANANDIATQAVTDFMTTSV
jgi:hypothetical protein